MRPLGITNVVRGYRCASITQRPQMKDWVVVLTTAQGIPFNLVCTRAQVRMFQVGRVYDYIVHPENFRAQRVVPPAVLGVAPKPTAAPSPQPAPASAAEASA